ncbi:MAG: hypothetical protein JSU58_06600 [Dehalococcoidales bacterium]|nr:MAG: hypothetical protein JSU58_06600 [Dehalococcoidales bacterium]
MNLEVGEWIVIKNEDKNGECSEGKVVGICRDSLDMINSYIMESSSGTYMQVKPNKVCRCNRIGSCSLRRAFQN